MITTKRLQALLNCHFPVCIIFLFAFIQTGSLQSQNILPRLDQGALLEPQGKIMNGAGQDQAEYMNYWNVMHAQNKPLVYMTYLSLREATSSWAEGLKANLMLTGKFQIPQIGLSMAADGTPASHYEQDVAAGLYDDEITAFIDGLESLAGPAYVRIGYEFNGTGWNGYQPETYKSAFIRITNMIRARGLEVATVWDLAMDGVMNFMDYYPGDAYVDWWAINFFSASHFTDPGAQAFLDGARAHSKPVLIGETTPRYVGVLNGQTSWDQWFDPFFTYIHSHPEVKEFSYINWDWSQYPQWQNWGDARLQKNAIVGGYFAGEMDSVQYLHASTESAFRKTLGSTDNTAPATPGAISVTHLGYPLQLNWDAVTDPSGLSHYIVYKHGVLADYTLTLPYSDKNIAAGDTITYAVSAMDRAGNESQRTAGLLVTVPSSINKALNGEFDKGTQDWHLSLFSANAAATMAIDSGSVISGPKSCKVSISQVSGTNWHIELWQWLAIHPGHRYKITFKAKASSTKVITLGVQESASPYTMYLGKDHTLTNTVQTFTDTVTISTADQAKVEFFLGSSTATVWIDSVAVIETSTGTLGMDEPKPANDVFALEQNYPNPFHSSTTIGYRIADDSFVSLRVIDRLGREVATLVNEQKHKGEYSIDWNATGLVGGIYFCRLQAGLFSETKKLIIQK